MRVRPLGETGGRRGSRRLTLTPPSAVQSSVASVIKATVGGSGCGWRRRMILASGRCCRRESGGWITGMCSAGPTGFCTDEALHRGTIVHTSADDGLPFLGPQQRGQLGRRRTIGGCAGRDRRTQGPGKRAAT
uniref:Uncharacterized protein n=1 Tax=Oryza punctata TaxID=4537 RepID=A0A0E0MLU3_ORYPU